MSKIFEGFTPLFYFYLVLVAIFTVTAAIYDSIGSVLPLFVALLLLIGITVEKVGLLE